MYHCSQWGEKTGRMRSCRRAGCNRAFGPGGVQAFIQVEKWGSGGVSAKVGNASVKRRQQVPLTHPCNNVTPCPPHCQCLAPSIFGGGAGPVNIHAWEDPMPVGIGVAPGARTPDCRALRKTRGAGQVPPPRVFRLAIRLYHSLPGKYNRLLHRKDTPVWQRCGY